MKTKYNVSVDNTYLGPINPPPDYLVKEEMVNTSTQTDRANNDDNNNPMVFSNLHYECRLKTQAMGEMRFYAGHYKHTFSTCDRIITCKVIKGQVKVKSGAEKLTLIENNIIKLNKNSKYFAKNNSLHNECVIKFILERN